MEWHGLQSGGLWNRKDDPDTGSSLFLLVAEAGEGEEPEDAHLRFLWGTLPTAGSAALRLRGGKRQQRVCRRPDMMYATSGSIHT